jgi:galactokinase
MGDHTDYNDGFVLPTAIAQRTVVELARGGGETEAFSVTLGKRIAFDARGGEMPGFSRYIGGCLRVLAEHGFALPVLKFTVTSDVPVGMGLSSSAALEVATLRAINTAFHLNLSDRDIAQFAWEAETKHAGVNCGIMDQMACTFAQPGRMLFLDTRNRAIRHIALPRHSEVLVVDSGVSRSLAASGYNSRRAECETAARFLGVTSLREVSDIDAAEKLSPPLDRRVRHVVTENARVLAACNADAEAFGRLMNESHASLRDDYAVSHPVVDALVAALQRSDLVFGARMTGAGFGGGLVALAQPGAALALVPVLASVQANAHIASVIASDATSAAPSPQSADEPAA